MLYDNEKTSASNVKAALDELFEKAKPKYDLASVVSVGDYVAYDAGTWTETKVNKPTIHGEFSGYIAGQNKANSVDTSLKGWRVLSVDASTKTITIVHAGQPEYYYHGTNPSSSITNLNNRATSTYLNSTYASSAHAMNKGEADAIDQSSNLRNIGAQYWLASDCECGVGNLWDVYIDGVMYTGNSSGVMGFRPVVVLKSGIKTIGKVKDAVGNEAWNLVTP